MLCNIIYIYIRLFKTLNIAEGHHTVAEDDEESAFLLTPELNLKASAE